jgi:hypothetical protein
MPPEVNSSPNVTKLHRLIDATAVDSVCQAGDRVRIAFATREGLVAVTVPRASFVEVARAERDSNLRPFTRVEREPAALAAPQVQRSRMMPEELQTKCERAWLLLTANDSLTQRAAAVAEGLTPAMFNGWVQRNRAFEWQAVQQSRRARAAAVQGDSSTPAVRPEKPVWLQLRTVGPLPTGHRDAPAEAVAEIRRAWGLYIQHPEARKQRQAIVLGISQAALTKYYAKFSAEPGAPVLKPNGRLA